MKSFPIRSFYRIYVITVITESRVVIIIVGRPQADLLTRGIGAFLYPWWGGGGAEVLKHNIFSKKCVCVRGGGGVFNNTTFSAKIWGGDYKKHIFSKNVGSYSPQPPCSYSP